MHGVAGDAAVVSRRSWAVGGGSAAEEAGVGVGQRRRRVSRDSDGQVGSVGAAVLPSVTVKTTVFAPMTAEQLAATLAVIVPLLLVMLGDSQARRNSRGCDDQTACRCLGIADSRNRADCACAALLTGNRGPRRDARRIVVDPSG